MTWLIVLGVVLPLLPIAQVIESRWGASPPRRAAVLVSTARQRRSA
ncbi:MAG TPA: hypothetical protein VFS60_15720 [Thermoanaerobaculia bacterium]|nr:hypothetical protein [Thermoanaerobaculia bacterium]